MSGRALALLLALSWGCGGGGSAAPEPTPASPTPDAAAPSTIPDPPTVMCGLPAGIREVHIKAGGAMRKVLVRRGSKAEDTAPLVFAWHGFGSSAENQLGAMRAESYFDHARVVAPQGLDRTFEKFGDTPRAGWQTHEGELDDRDLALFDAIMDQLESCTEPKAVYSTGFSNGGFFSNLLGCARADEVTAIAPVGGGFRGDVETCPQPVPTLIIHGTLDDVVPVSMAWEAASIWHAANGCDKRETPAGPHCVASTCDTPLSVCHFEGKHTWPAWASEEIAAFFAAQH